MGYPGGKSGSGVFQALINWMPPHSLYVEPFLGGGAVMRYKRPAERNIGIDLDPEVISQWSTVSGSGGAGSGGAAGGGARSPKGSALELATGTGTLELTASAHGGAPRGPDAGIDGRALESSAGKSGGASRWHFLVCDGIQFLAMNSRLLSADALVYCDPPYLHSTRVCTRHYRHEMTDAQHEELLRVVKGLRCRVMVSGYSSPLYARMLKGWNATSFQAGTRGKPAAEWVWFNFDRPEQLHDYRFLGDSKRERERIRRKQRRWVHRLAVMPLLERQALLSAIAETAGNGGAAGTSAEVAVFGGSAPGVRAAKK